MRVQLHFVHRSENDDDHYDKYDIDNDDGPLQLIRHIPESLSAYVTASDYEDFCIRKIDPLLEALYETEESTRRSQTCILIVSLMLFVCGCLALFSESYDIFLVTWCVFFVLTLMSILVMQNFPGRQIEEEIRSECERMSERCNNSSNNNATNGTSSSSTHLLFFDLVMKRVWHPVIVTLET